ncbi:MAG: cytochrome c [Spirosomataceae bacterium]
MSRNKKIPIFLKMTGLWLTSFLALGQEPVTYATHIQPIIAKNCVVCHRPGGIGPFSLITYQDVAKRSKFIAKVTQIRFMPPFPANRNFQHYANERGLTEVEIALIQQWNKEGALEGKSKVKNRKEVDASSVSMTKESMAARKPDLVLKMPNAFTVPNTGEEEFRYFHVPTGLKKDVMVEAIEFLPGNRKVLHHSRVMVDTSGKMATIEGMRADDPQIATFQQIPMADEFLYGWVPGNDRIQFPAGVAKKIKANSNLILNVHYSPSATIETDQSVVNLYFAKKPVKREVKSLALFEPHITNPPFFIKANTKPTFYISYGPTKEAMSAISILPHMHWLGQSFKAFAITPEGDLVPLVKIDAWDFNWQMTYQFEKLLHIPIGSVILAEASYDNTPSNPLNPFNPPKDTTFGWNTTAEMMQLVIYYVDYQKGDEDIKQ